MSLIKPQPEQKIEQLILNAMEAQLVGTDARTYYDEDGVIVFIGGINRKWENHAQIWSIISKAASPHMLQITREIREWIDLYCKVYRRIECQVQKDFEHGNRWAKLLGFQLDGTLPKFFVDGTDACIYSRINFIDGGVS